MSHIDPIATESPCAKTGRGEGSAMPCCEEKVSRTIAGEDAPGAIAAVCCGRESHDHDARVLVTEARDRTSPVHFVAIRTTLLACDFLAPCHQSRARTTRDDLRV